MYLVINSGSSSIKFKGFEDKIPVAMNNTGMTSKKEDLKEIISGIVEKI